MRIQDSHPRLEIAEAVLPGHPDKLCDAAVDAVVDTVRRHDPGGQCGLEAAAIFDSIYLTGRIAAEARTLRILEGGDSEHAGIEALVRGAYRAARYGEDSAGHTWGPEPDTLAITCNLRLGPYEDGERELRYLVDDQAVCVGYACADAATDHLPPAHWLARRIARALFDLQPDLAAGHAGPDGKVLVTVTREGETWRPCGVSMSLSHHEHSDGLRLRRFGEAALEHACAGLPVPPLRLNGAGSFTCAGPMGDNGLSGKKLVVDAYGPTLPIGGGAWSGKDLRKVDRLGGLLARELALAAVAAGLGREATVTLAYEPGGSAPATVHAIVDGATVHDLPERLGGLDVDNRRVAARYVAADADLIDLARWGHQVAGMPWEGSRRAADAVGDARLPSGASPRRPARTKAARRINADSSAQQVPAP